MTRISIQLAAITAVPSFLVATQWIFPGVFSFLISASNLVCAFASNRKKLNKPYWISTITFVLSIIIFSFGAYAKNELDKEASKAAAIFQTQLCNTGKASEPDNTWEKSSPNARAFTKKISYLQYSFKIYYFIQPNMQDFFVQTKYSFDLYGQPINGSLSACGKP